MKLKNGTYDVLKWVATIVMPSLSVLYGTLGKIWGLPFTEQIPLTITAIQVFMTALLGISSTNYYKDQVEEVVVDENESDLG